MPHEVTCPTCKHILSIPEGTQGRWLTCPRCLASVANPNVLFTTEVPAAPSRTEHPARERPAEQPPALPATSRCPECDRPIERGWRLCPYCGAALRERRPRPRRASVDEEVSGDSTGVGIVLVVLGALGGLGLLLFLCGGGDANLGLGVRRSTGIAFVVGMVLLGLVVAGVAVSATSREAAGRMAGVVLGTLSVILLVCVLGIAAFVYSVASCFDSCQPRPNQPAQPPAPVVPDKR